MYGLYHYNCGGHFVGVTLTIYVKLNWHLKFLMYSFHAVISVLNAFQVEIVLRSIQYLRLVVYAFGQ